LGRLLELTAVSAICLLGLAIWFSKTEPLVATATSCYPSHRLGGTPFNLGVAFFISKRFFCQAAVAAPFHRFSPSGLNTAPPRFVSSFRVGARNLLPSRLPCQLPSSTLSSPQARLRRLRDSRLPEGLRLLPPPPPESTPLR